MKGAKVSWVNGYGDRLFGHVIRKDGNYYIIKPSNCSGRARVYKGNITFERP